LILETRRQKLAFGELTSDALFGWSATFYFGGLPRLANVNPRESAEQRSRLARLRASLRSGPGGIRRARSNASAARISQSILSGERCVSLFMIQLVANS
jgi:hypothetical protein